MASITKRVSREMVALDATASCREAAQLMSERKIGSIAVKESGRIAGLVTERDLVAAVLARGNDSRLPIREAMRPGIPPVAIGANETEAAELMRVHGTRHLLVQDQGQVVGVVSMQDLIRTMLDEKQFLIEQLQTYIDGR